jgi:hypothetical protein
MTTGSGLRTSYDNTVPLKRTITDRIIMTDPHDIVLITALGLDNQSKFAFVNTPGRTYEWLEDAYPAVSDLAADTTLTNVTNSTTITITTPALFHVGDVVQLEATGDLVWVASIAGSVLTVVRGFGGTTPVTHASTSTVYIRYNARLEGATNSASPWTEVVSNYNYSTIMHKSVSVTRDDKLFPKYGGVAGQIEHLIDLNMDILTAQLAAMPYYAYRSGTAGSTTVARAAGGFPTFLTTNALAAASAALTRKAIDDKFQTVFAAGGKIDLIVCDAWGQRKINDFYEGFVQTARGDTVGGMMIKQLMHPITGDLVNVVVDRQCPAGSMFMLDRRYVGFITIDPFFYEEMAKTGDSTQGETIGEYGFVMAANKFHAKITGYSTTA